MELNFDFSRAVMEDPDVWVFYDGYLILYLLQKFLFTALTLSCDVPGGIFTPTFAIGAVFGQLYVSVVIKILAFFQIFSFIQCKFRANSNLFKLGESTQSLEERL